MPALLDGLDASAIERQLALPVVHLFATIGSTMDEAHRLAGEGAPGGTLVIAGEQTAGRGRGGKRWSSAPGLGLWFTLIERPNSPSGLDVLSLRLGLRAGRRHAAGRSSGPTPRYPEAGCHPLHAKE